MREEGTTMAADEQNPEEQNPERRTPGSRRSSLRRRSTRTSSGTSSTPTRALSARCASRSRAASQAFGLQNRIGRIMIPTEPVTETAQRQEVHHRARLPARLRAGRDGTRQRPLARHQEHAARHRLPRHGRQAGGALRGRKSAPSSSVPTSAKDKPTHEGQVRQGRAGPHQRRPIRQLHRHRRRRQRRPPDIEGDGHASSAAPPRSRSSSRRWTRSKH